MYDHIDLKKIMGAVLLLPILVTAIWLSYSPVDLSSTTIPFLANFIASVIGMAAVAKLVLWRLRNDTSRVASKIRYAASAMYWISLAAIALTCSNFFMLSGGYLGASLALPLHDGNYAAFSKAVGFDWLAIVSWINQWELGSASLQWAYKSTLYQTPILVFALAVLHQKDGLLEYVALYSITGFVTILFAILVPALGAYAYYQPEPAQFSNLGATPGLWHLSTVEGLRAGEQVPVDFNNPEGIVTFPSFHTILAIITTYSARNIRFVFFPLAVLNGWVIISTVPVGGHYLIDLIAGAALAFGTIWMVERLMRTHDKIDEGANELSSAPLSPQAG